MTVPFRNFVARTRRGRDTGEHQAFFTKMLGDVDQPTAPFGLREVQGSGSNVREAFLPVDSDLGHRLRSHARRLGVSAASLHHAAWGLLVARCANQPDPVCGTVLFGRMGGGEDADQALGLFINTLPIRFRLHGRGVEQFIGETHQLLAELLNHEHASLMLAQRCSRVAAPTPLFTTLFNYRHNRAANRRAAPPRAVEGITYLRGEERSNYPVTLSVDDFGEAFRLKAQAITPVEPGFICALMHRSLEQLIDALDREPDRLVEGLDILPEAERQKLLVKWNAADVAYPQEHCLHEQFEAQAARDPQAIALVAEAQTLSYGELNARANQLAQHLRDLGVTADAPVGLCVDRSIDMIVGLLAILKAGGGYVPLDAAYPPERLAYMLQDSAPRVVLTHAATRSALATAVARVPALTTTVVDLTDDAAAWASRETDNLPRARTKVTPQHLAYIIYTSGSTGQPKGVMVPHAAVSRLFAATEAWVQADAQDVWTLFHSVAFDFSVWEIWGALRSGGRLVIVPAAMTRAPEEFYERLCDAGVTILNQTPSAFGGLLRAQARSERAHRLRLVIFGGEALSPAVLAPWYERVGNAATRLVNMYGITETTVHVTAYPLSAADVTASRSPIGRPIADLQVYVLDRWGHLAPSGVTGELYVGGAGLARGYRDRPGLTATRFVANPFSSGARLYRTGDLGRYLPDGTLEYLGRNDWQVKVRGFRIELGEIEAHLASHPDVREAVVVASEEAAGETRLVAYYTATDRGCGAEELRQHLAAQVPEHMVPAAYVRLEALPLTAHGKLDRAALPAPDANAYGRQGFVAPQGVVEETLARIWSEVLGVTAVSRHDDFFALGGHSLMALQMFERMREAGLIADINSLFGTSVLADMAATVTLSGDTEPAIPPVPRDGPLVPSFSQRRLWFLSQIGDVSAAYHVPFGVRLEGRIDQAALKRALRRLVERHEALRTTFYAVDGELFQRINLADFELRLDDLSKADDPEALTHRLVLEEFTTPFDLAHGPVFRARLIRQSPSDAVLLLTMHHIVADGWSMRVLLRELQTLYRAYTAGESDALLPLRIQYADYAAWQRQRLSGDLLAELSAYWQQALAGAPATIELPADRPRPVEQDFTGGTLPVQLDSALTAQLKDVSRRHGLTLFMTVLTGWAAVLSRLTNQRDIVIGVPSANRTHADVEGVIGFFVNTLALRVDVGGDRTVAELLDHVKKCVLDAQAHQEMPFEQVVDLVKPVRSLNHTPVFQVMVVWQGDDDWALDLPDVKARDLKGGQHPAKFDLTLSLREHDDQIVGGLNYATALFERATIRRFVGYLETALQSMVTNEQQLLASLPILSHGEQQRLLLDWNATDSPSSHDRCIHELFEAHASRQPDAVAVVYGRSSLTYGELDGRANQLAHHLRTLGIRRDSPVGICVERALEMIVGLLAIVKSGGAYVPLDPAYPTERLGYMLRDSAPRAVLTHPAASERLHAALRDADMRDTTVVDLERDEGAWTTSSSACITASTIGLTPQHLAYIIYTSGSTGRPKGVMVEHRHLVASTTARFARYKPAASLLLTPSFAFDSSVATIFWSLTSGARLVVPSDDVVRDVSQLAALIAAHQVDTWLCVPSLYNVLLDDDRTPLSSSLQTVIVAGEAVSPQLVDRHHARARRECSLHNEYGPTEATVWATSFHCVPSSRPSVPIGRPIANVRMYVLDRWRNVVPENVIGELYIGGAGVARGYWHRPALTSERFVASPFVAGDRLYRTGDLGRYLPDGNIEFLGRDDFQVKVRGFRIELGEIEAQLLDHPGVREAVVISQEDIPADTRLVAYYVARDETASDADDLRRHLAKRLPDYMVPAAYVRIDALPLTANGKLDRQALPAAGRDAYGRRDDAAPEGGIEETLAKIWSEVLRVDRVSRRDDFFALGGHSLLAVRLLERMRVAGLNADIRMLFAAPVLADLAAAVQVSPDILPPIARVPRDTALRPSFAQQRLWFLSQIDGVSEAYHISFGLRLRGRLEDHALAQALAQLEERHEALRTTFYTVDGELFQRITPSSFLLRREDLSAATNPQADLDAQVRDEFTSPFDLTRGPLFRARLIRMGPEDHVLLVAVHHIVSDGWSMGVLLRELQALYRTDGSAERALTPLPIQYADYAAWQRQWLSGTVLSEQSVFWQRTLAGAPVLELPTDRPRPVQQDFSGAIAPLVLDAVLTAGLKDLSRRKGLTLFMTVLAGWAAVLSRLANQDDIVIGVPTANRSRAEIEGLIGCFVNTLALRIDLGGEPTVGGLLDGVKKVVVDAQAHQDLPFEQVVDLVKPVRSLNRTPLFQVMVGWQGSDDATSLALPGLDVQELGISEMPAKFDLTLSLRERDGEIAGSINYATALFDAATIDGYAEYLSAALRAMVADETRLVSTIPLLSAREQQLLVDWNASEVPYPQDLCVHELFESQARRDPDAVAVVYEEQALSYAELNARSNQLAHQLRDLGVGPDIAVAICVERSVEMLIGLLAILKAGGAYVPLAPTDPSERLREMLRDSAPRVVLTHAAGRAPLAVAEARAMAAVVDLDADASNWRSQPTGNLPRTTTRLAPRHVAYVIYTSGSTGRPKGVMNEHRGLTNRLCWMQDAYALGADEAILQKTPFTFDVSVWEFFWPLMVGAKLVLARPGGHQDPDYLTQVIARQQITRLHFVPSMLAVFLEHPEAASCRSVRDLFCSGEALPTTVVRRCWTVWPGARLHNLYGPTEAAVDVTAWECRAPIEAAAPPIGRPIANLRMYVLDRRLQAVPRGAAGELYIGGVGVARGYLQRPGLTAERFVASPFEQGARLYRTGDLGRHLPDGTLEYLGRNDWQVKIRGFRIELGEIEAHLTAHPGVREAVVVAREAPAGGETRLVAYYTCADRVCGIEELRQHLAAQVPDHMVPAAYVRLDALPLTAHGKLDRDALPAPDAGAYARHAFVAPVGEIEQTLAQIWAEELGVGPVGRADDFFALGGHSLLAIRVLDRMRRAGLQATVRTLFATPVLVDVARLVEVGRTRVEAPPNPIADGCAHITPELLPLLALTQDEIDRIVATVPGGAANIQDVYPLAPLQEGLWFHHVMAQRGDPYLLWSEISFDTRARLTAYVAALNAVIARHDILRTAVVWEGLSEPVQVVWRRAPVAVEEVALDPAAGDVAEQLRRRYDPRRCRLDVRHAPLMRLCAACDPTQQRWVLLWISHHLAGDHETLEVVHAEIGALMADAATLLPPVQPFRNFIAHATRQSDRAAHEAFFTAMLGDVREPTAPFGVWDVQGDGADIEESRQRVDAALSRQVRMQARRLRISPASLFHAAWGLVLARCTGRPDPVCGSVLFGRMDGGEETERALGLYINTLPLRFQLATRTVEQAVRDTQQRLAELLQHEHASLVMAQRCSGVPPATPLFTTLINYRHSGAASEPLRPRAPDGVTYLRGEERTNYPIAVTVDDLGEGFLLKAQTRSPLPSVRVCALMHRALEQIVDALEHEPGKRVEQLDVLPSEARHRLLIEWNETAVAYPSDRGELVHEWFEAQVARRAEATAVVHDGVVLTYADLNARANRLARHLRGMNVSPDTAVAICLSRSPSMIVSLLAVMKSGGAYVPLDPSLPPTRLAYMLNDSAPRVVLADSASSERLQTARTHAGGHVNPIVVNVERDADAWATRSSENVTPTTIGLTARHLAYIIYTSGSTGRPKGVMVEHRSLANLIAAMRDMFGTETPQTVLSLTTLSFDIAGLEIYVPLVEGGCVVLADSEAAKDPVALTQLIDDHRVSLVQATPSTWQLLDGLERKELDVICGGEALSAALAASLSRRFGRVRNCYGPTETTIWSTCGEVENEDTGSSLSSLGRPIANTRIYILDADLNPVPLGVEGEIYIGGAGVARGYWRKPALTAERFLASPFVEGDRLYKTGDLGRYRADGRIEFLGRNDFQVKLRGFRIELGEIEAQLTAHRHVRDAIVVAREDTPGDVRLVAYYTTNGSAACEPGDLAQHLAARLPDYMVPSAYVRLEQLPLTPNRKLDRQALPLPEREAYRGRGDEPPRGEVEQALAAIWSAVLGISDVGRHDDFFALGGHSLLAVQALERIRDVLRVELPLQLLFASRTVAALAQQLAVRYPRATSQLGERAQRSPVVLIKHGSTAPLFLFHPIGGGLGCYDELTALLDDRTTVYGIHGMYPGLDAATTIEELASGYVAQICAVESHGPYRLLGYSFGTLLATEVARQLERQGRHVDLLAFIDTPPPPARTPSDSAHWLWREFMVAVGLDPVALEADHPELLDERHSGNCEMLVPYMKRRYTADALAGIYRRFCRNNAAVASYVQRPLHTPVLLYRANRSTDDDSTVLRTSWRFDRIVPVDADHQSIVTGAAIQKIASDLNAFQWVHEPAPLQAVE